MELSIEERKELIENLIFELEGKLDGSKKNVLVQDCPFCGHGGYKFGIYVGKNIPNEKTFGSSHCFYCGKSFRTLRETLEGLNLVQYLPKETEDLEEDIVRLSLVDDEIEDELETAEMPYGYKRTFRNAYLKSRGFQVDDYEYFPCGTCRGVNRDFEDYVLLEVRDHGRLVGYVARKTWSKDEIDEWNDTHRYKVRRYNNSKDNLFSRMLYNYDAVKEDETNTVVLCEGAFDVIGLTNKMELYDNTNIVPVATFGKQISLCQMMKLQQKGVKTVVIGYDNDEAAKDSMRKVIDDLSEYFDVYCLLYPEGNSKDFGDMSVSEIYNLFANCIVTPREYNLNSRL